MLNNYFSNSRVKETDPATLERMTTDMSAEDPKKVSRVIRNKKFERDRIRGTIHIDRLKLHNVSRPEVFKGSTWMMNREKPVHEDF